MLNKTRYNTFRRTIQNITMSAHKSYIQSTEFIYNIFESMISNNMNYVYRGLLTPKVTDSILLFAESFLTINSLKKGVRKKVYHVMVEGLQNINKHQSSTHSELSTQDSIIFILKGEDNNFFVTTGNLIDKSDTSSIVNKIEYVNKLDKVTLREYYKKVLIEGSISDKGGAGLGFIDIAIKTGNKLSFAFEDVDKTHSYFYLGAKVSSNSDIDCNDAESDKIVKKQCVKEIRKAISDAGILMIFNSFFNQQVLVDLLSIIKHNIAGTLSFQKRLYSIVVEMIHNIMSHADNYNDDISKDGAKGLFYIIDQADAYFVNTGNFILKSKVAELKERFTQINLLNEVELEGLYDEQLNADAKQDTKLGLIDIRIKSGNYLSLDFFDVNPTHSFCIISTKINKEKSTMNN